MVGCSDSLMDVHRVLSSAPNTGLALIWDIGITGPKAMPKKVLLVNENLASTFQLAAIAC